VKEGKYIQDRSLTFGERTDELEKAISAQEKKMRNFFEKWAEKGCTFDFSENVYVTKLRDHIASVHQKTMFKRLPEIIKALTKEKKMNLLLRYI
jgi:uracil DNA glycosylase